ncbi:MAG: rod shape-determining protein MreD [Bacilli bacterium]|nr:rod shape-determining protein MreD [Bacilli bacterium]
MMVILVLIISFILDSIISNLVSINGLFLPLFTVMSLIIVYPYFNNKRNKFYLSCFITGIFYDLIYTNTIVIHGFLFLLLGFIITRMNLLLANNFINVVIMGIILIVVYRSLTYGLILITANASFDLFNLFRSIYSSLIMNIFFVSIAYIIIDKISYKFKIHKAN